jgi:hypothetical protein
MDLIGKQFFATEAAFRAVLLLFNLLAAFQRAAGLPIYREPATIRAQVLTCGALLGRAGRRLVLHLSDSWGGLKTRIPLLDSILNWQIPTFYKHREEGANAVADADTRRRLFRS